MNILIFKIFFGSPAANIWSRVEILSVNEVAQGESVIWKDDRVGDLRYIRFEREVDEKMSVNDIKFLNSFLIKKVKSTCHRSLLMSDVIKRSRKIWTESVKWLGKSGFCFFWLHWVFIAARGLSLVVASRGYSLLWSTGFSLWWLLFLRSTGSRHAGFSSCGSQA